MDPGWLSNAYLIGDEPGGTAVFVDSGAPLEPLFEAVEQYGLTVTHLLTTHADADHVAGDDEIIARYGLPDREGRPRDRRPLDPTRSPTPGHKDDHLAFVVNDEACFTGDMLFKDAVGGGDFEQIRALGDGRADAAAARDAGAPGPHRRDDDRPGMGGEPVRASSGAEPSPRAPSAYGSAGRRRRSSSGRRTTTARARRWVRFADGRDAIVGGSRVERG